MKKEYISPCIEIILFDNNIILSDSVVAGNPYQPGDENIDGNDFFN